MLPQWVPHNSAIGIAGENAKFVLVIGAPKDSKPETCRKTKNMKIVRLKHA